ncbi:MAG: tyrosine-type recombinase/integrase [Nitrospina sp.]|jgi:integrase|nr:tyrosine-type recombinase/integrase [Nitrospina sp.]MBT3924168.1 tyrosine-type recombinase/integrase [Nitrospina sp.]
MRLTKKKIDGFKYEGKPLEKGFSRDVRWDDEISGFGCRVYPSEVTGKNRKSFIISYRSNGRKRLLTIGAYGVFTLEQARSKARSHLGKVEDGHDPLEAKKIETQEHTFRELSVAYMERHAKIHKKTWRTDENRLKRYIIPAFGSLRVKAIRRNDVAVLHHKIGKKTPYEANRNIKLLSIIFNCAKEWGYLEETAINPANGIKPFKEEERDRYVTQEELPNLAKAIDREENIYVRACLWLYLLAGVRKSELLQAKWNDVSIDHQELRLPDTKSGKPRYVPLSGQAIIILQSLPRFEDNPYVLPGKKKGCHLVNIDKPWRRIREVAGIKDVRLHDLRRTVGSWLGQSGSSLHLIGKVLGHSDLKTTAIYSRFAQDHVKEALENHGKRLMGIAGKEPVAEIVNMPAKRRGKKKKART